MKKYICFTAFAFAVSLITFQSCKTSSQASSSKLLRFNLEQGKGYDYDMVWDMDMKTGGQDSRVTVDGRYAMQIAEDNGSVKTVATTYKSIRLAMTVMGMELEVDSDKPLPDNGNDDAKKNPLGAMNKVMKGMVNKPFMVKVNQEGDVLDVSGFDNIVRSMVDSLGLSEEEKAQAMASIKDQFNDQSIKDNFAMMFTIFPNKEVKVGDSWEKTYNTGGKMAAKFTTTYTVKEIEGDHVSLRAQSKISSSKDEMEITGTQTGNIVIDSKTGLMINGEYDQDMVMKTQGQTIDVTGKGKIKGRAIN